MTTETQERKARLQEIQEKRSLAIYDDLVNLLEGCGYATMDEKITRKQKIELAGGLEDLIGGSWEYTANDDVPDCDSCDERMGEPMIDESRM